MPMRFRTEIDLPPSGLQLGYDDRILTAGSCFAEHISTFFRDNRFKVSGNPFGVLYNPVSVNALFEAVHHGTYVTERDLVFHNGEWHSFLFDSTFSGPDKTDCIHRMNHAVESTRNFIKKTRIVIITYGTAFVYTYKKTGKIVSNCHKFPADAFDYSRLSVEDGSSLMQSTIKHIQELNPETRMIFTVSPVRHWKNGPTGNQRSKATLILALEEVLNTDPGLHYFPAYELLMDDLRDYRFYEADLIHPNQMAVSYILDKFTDSFINPESQAIMKEIQKIIRARNHRPRNRTSLAYREFLDKHLILAEDLMAAHASLDLFEDRKYFKQQIHNFDQRDNH